MAALTGLRNGAGNAAAAMPPRPAANALGRVEQVEAGNVPSNSAPSNADILAAINELGKKVHQLSKNQQVLDAKLDHVTKRVAAVDTNLIRGITFLNQCSLYLEALVIVDGDANLARPYLPGRLPHWQ